jgi:hypothetical protein
LLIAIVTTVLGAVLGTLGTLTVQRFTEDRISSSAPPTTTNRVVAPPTSGMSQAATSSDPTATTDVAEAPQIRWRKAVRLARIFAVDLDADGPRVSMRTSSSDLQSFTLPDDTTGDFSSYNGAQSGSAPSADPSLADCRDAVETAGLPVRFRLEHGRAVCVRTQPPSGSQPHLAVVRLLTIDRTSGSVTVDITVWAESP